MQYCCPLPLFHDDSLATCLQRKLNIAAALVRLGSACCLVSSIILTERLQRVQGTFLKEAVGADLEAMGSHTALNSASDKVPLLSAPPCCV